jgi:hypothetical protein
MQAYRNGGSSQTRPTLQMEVILTLICEVLYSAAVVNVPVEDVAVPDSLTATIRQ